MTAPIIGEGKNPYVGPRTFAYEDRHVFLAANARHVTYSRASSPNDYSFFVHSPAPARAR